MSASTGKFPAVPAAGGEGGSDAAAGGSPCGRPTRFAGAGEEARARREAEKAELEKKIASTKEEIVALEAALAEVDAANGPEPAKP